MLTDDGLKHGKSEMRRHSTRIVLEELWGGFRDGAFYRRRRADGIEDGYRILAQSGDDAGSDYDRKGWISQSEG